MELKKTTGSVIAILNYNDSVKFNINASSTGQECRLFEKEFAAAVECDHAISLANGTLAIELALHALGIGPGDDVIVPPRTFIATASAVWARGARPIFADVDLISGNVSAETIEAAMTPNTKAIIPVHIAGWPCEMDKIMDLAHDRGMLVIEDCAQAHGATYKGQPVGSIGQSRLASRTFANSCRATRESI